MKFNGQMVRAFSSFVVGSSGTQGIVIGFIIFIIIIVVQALVITKGSSRVSEVSARFALDAMPTKQMTIESEYNSGAITEEEMKARKRELQTESDFYGNMDGASKFISNNVKAGIFITVINFIGGLIIGMVIHGEPFNAAIETYASLTIGDGLLSQLPSLLISFATGLIVTRSAAEEGATLGSDIKNQFTRDGTIYLIAGGAMILLGLLPKFPKFILFSLGALLIFWGVRNRKMDPKKEASAGQGGTKASGGAQTASGTQQKTPAGAVSPVVPLDLLSLELGFRIIPLLDEAKGGNLKERISKIRREIGLDLGLVVPPIHMIDNINLEPTEYSFKIRGVEVEKGRVRTNSLLAMNTGGVTEEIAGEATRDPVFGMPAIWIGENDRERAERNGYAVVDPPTIITTHITEMVRNNAAEILGRQEVKQIIETLRKDYPAVVEDAEKLFSTGEIQKVMQGLLREKVSIRNMVSILETMSDFGTVTKQTSILIEKVRQKLGRQICLQYADETKTIHVLTVDPKFLQVLVDSRADTLNGPITTLDLPTHRAWISAVSNAIANVENSGYMPIIMCPEEARPLVKISMEREMPGVVVLSVSEIANDIKVESLGEIHVEF
jgi:flagellar biosynthesis protein FlhA